MFRSNAYMRSVLAKSAGADYNINFNDPNALPWLPDQAYITFAPFYIPQVRSGAASNLPRKLAPHEASEKVQIYAWDGSKRYVFDLKSIYLLPTSDLN
jgi:hypothetical protein